jgi:type I restriction enzyme S subunit
MLSEVPEGWQISTLGEVCNPKQHPTIQKTKLTSEGYPVYGANGQIGFFSDYTHEDRTLAITCRGATCGTINVVPPKSYITGNAMALDSLDESAVAFDFLNHYLRHFGVDACITGSAQPQITRSSLLPVELALPPLNEQHCIAEILSSVDASIQATQAVIEQAERVRRGLMEELLTGGLGSQAIERGEVPEGWDKKPLSDLLSKAYGGGTPSKSEPAYWGGDIYWASVKDMTDFNPLCTKDTITQAGLDNSSSKIVPAGELIFCTRMAVGSTRRYQVDVAINQDLRALIPSDSLRRDYLYYWLLSKRSEFEDESTGTTVKGLRQERLLAKKLLFPCLNEQKRIAEALSDSDDFIARQKSIVEQQSFIKRGLMNDLLTGKVRTI